MPNLKLQVFSNYLYANSIFSTFKKIKVSNSCLCLLFVLSTISKNFFTVTTSPGAPSLKATLRGFGMYGKVIIRIAIYLF